MVGRLLKAHGLAGEILASIDTGDPELIFTPGREFGFAIPAGDPPRSLTLETARPHKGGYLLRFREIASREAVDPVRGREITVPPDVLRPLEENEFFLHDLVGLEAWREGGERIGAVIEVYELAGEKFNLGSPKQLQEILFGELGLPVIRKTVFGKAFPFTN